jgi:hypothetical protein
MNPDPDCWMLVYQGSEIFTWSSKRLMTHAFFVDI